MRVAGCRGWFAQHVVATAAPWHRRVGNTLRVGSCPLGQRLLLGRAEPTARSRPILRRRAKSRDAVEKAALPSREGG